MKATISSTLSQPGKIFFWLLSVMFMASCQQPKDALLADDAAIADESQTENWLAYGRTHNERRFSPLQQINESNVANLKVDWFIDLPNDRGLVSTPLVIDGVLYFCGTMNIVRAVDATSGKLIWQYDLLNDEQANRGANEYRVCAACHGRGVIAGGMAPDLRASPIPLVKEAFEEVVRKGAKTNMGMPAFPDMTDEQLSSIMHYIRQQARAGIPTSNSNGPH